jgi:chemotaxis protein methyltransferase CheR
VKRVPPTITDDDFAAVRDYLAGTAGLVFDVSRRASLAAAVAERLAATGSRDVATYLAHVQSRRGGKEREQLLDTVTVQETHFFRNGPQMVALREHILPELLRRALVESRPLRIWSAGCSTGEEAYTLAMLALEAAAATTGTGGVRIGVLATDVSAAALATAAKATYAGRSMSFVDPRDRSRWFRPAGVGALAVCDEVRDLVELRLHNLVTDPVPAEPGSLDLIVCRNVTIYFSRETTRALVERFHAGLGPGGYLMLGHSETLWQLSDAFTLLPIGEAFAYRKDATAAARPRRAAAAARSAVVRLRPSRRPAPPAPPGAQAGAPVGVTGRGPELEPLRRRTAVGPGRDRAGDAAAAQAADLAAARAALADGRYADAVGLATQAAVAGPHEAAAWAVRGEALSTLGQDADALVALRKAVYLDPDAGDAHFLLAGALARLGDVRAAARAYRAAAAALPGTPPEALERLLDGRAVGDLVALCRRLGDAAEGTRATGGVA